MREGFYKMKKIALLAALALFMTVVYYIGVYRDIERSVIRLHVISNSNSEEDTKIKLMVRDAILDDVRGRLTRDSGREDVIGAMPEMEQSANDFLEKIGADYRAHIKFEHADIPRKEYNGIVLPKGNYEAIRVVLGEGGGENWWCVAYPPLCFTEQTGGGVSPEGSRILQNSMSAESYRMITSDVKYELKIVEVAEKLLRAVGRL